MTSLRNVIVATMLLLLACPAGAESETAEKSSASQPAPAGWLAMATLPDLGQADQLVQATLADLGYQFNGVRPLLQQLVGDAGAVAANDRLSIGLAADDARLDDDLLPFALWRLREGTTFEAFIARFQGEPFGDRALLSIAGVELIAAPRAGDGFTDVLIIDARRQDYLTQAWINQAESLSIPLPQGKLSTVHVNKLGLVRLNNELMERREGLNFVREGRSKWPKDLESLLNKAAFYTAIVEAFANRFDEISISFQQSNEQAEGQYDVLIDAIDSSNSSEHKVPFVPAVAVEDLTDRRSIGQVHLHSRSLSPRWTAPFELAYEQSTFAEAGIKRPDASLLKAYQQGMLNLAQQTQRMDGMVLTIGENQPVGTNRLALFSVEDAEDFFAAARATFGKWNDLVAKSETDMKLVFDLQETRLNDPAGPSDRPALLIQADMVEVIDVDVSPEIRQLMEDFYGNEGVFKQYYVALDPQTVLVSDLPLDEVRQACRRWDSATPEPPSATFSLHLDRYLAWKEQLSRLSMGEVIGRRPPPVMEESAPIEGTGQKTGDRVKLQLTLPRETLKAIGKLLR